MNCIINFISPHCIASHCIPSHSLTQSLVSILWIPSLLRLIYHISYTAHTHTILRYHPSLLELLFSNRILQSSTHIHPYPRPSSCLIVIPHPPATLHAIRHKAGASPSWFTATRCIALSHDTLTQDSLPRCTAIPSFTLRFPFTLAPRMVFQIYAALPPDRSQASLPLRRALQFRITYMLIGFLDFCASSAISVLLFSRAVSYVGVPRFLLQFDSHLIISHAE